MEKLFGIPMGPLAETLALLLGFVVAVLSVFAVRNRVFFKLGVRNVGRRRGRTALIVAGLMLGTTIIAAALASGDTMSHTIRSTAVRSMGSTDELIAAKGANADIQTPGDAVGAAYFAEQLFPRLARDLRRTGYVDGVAPAIVESIAVQDSTSRQNKSRVTLFASRTLDMSGFSSIRTVGGDNVTLAMLRPGEVYVNADAADDLEARAGDTLRLLAGERRGVARVRAVVRFDGAGTDGPAALVGLAAAQKLLGHEGEIKYVLVSNNGNALDGVQYTEQVTKLAKPTVSLLRLEIDPVKRDALDDADAAGNAFMAMFTTFGSFSIAAGILLIFLIFVMLAAERRGELGIARAVGTRRGHLVQMFVYEGTAYDLVAAAVGAALGIAIAFGMVFVLSSALGTQGITIEHDLRLRSIVVAYSIGVLLTLVVVSVSAWRVSRLNITTAIRNLPEPLLKARRRHWILGLVVIALGALMLVSGFSSAAALPIMLGASLVIAGAVPVMRAVGAGDRLAYTGAGLAIVGLWILPMSWVNSLVGRELSEDFSIFIVGGLLVVVGSTWVLIHNADLISSAVVFALRRVRGLTPILRMSMAYPLRNRFRTGVTLAMFTLVVFTLVVGASTSGSFVHAFDNLDRYGGGWDVRANAASVSPLGDPSAAIARAPGLHASDFQAISAMSLLPVDARQAGKHAGTYESYLARGLDRAYLRHTTYGFASVARGFGNPWRVMDEHPGAGYAVIDSLVVPRRENFNAGAVPPDFKVRGLYAEDSSFDAFPVLVRDPQTGTVARLTVIGVLKDFAAPEVYGISTSQATLSNAFGGRVTPTQYYFDLKPGVDARATAQELESAFLAHGVEADSLEKVLNDLVATNWTFNRLIQGFMGLGLLVGVAALGVISARAVVERRQQIGILRAIGFRRGAIQLSFLLESSFVALTAIVIGTLLGLVIARNVVADSGSSSLYEGVHLVVPWLNLVIVFTTVYAVSLLTTLAPAVRASRIYPAQALRYE
jgi:putative ABC transport system permease protein